MGHTEAVRWDADGPSTWPPTTYGAAVADIYDEWYPTRGDESQLVERLDALLGGDGVPRRLLELGVGTGRLAIPLTRAGWQVTGIDASRHMLDQLDAKARVLGLDIGAVHGDVADLSPRALGLPLSGPPRFDVVLAAFNFVLNLPDDAALVACLRLASQVASASGCLVVEAQLLAPDPGPAVVWVERENAGRPRRWPVRRLSIEELDAAAARTGWTVQERRLDWSWAPYDPVESPGHVTVYRHLDD